MTARGPDIAIVGAARAGTSFLSATLSNHPQIDGGAVKEPNYFSSRWGEGPQWYEGLFQTSTPGVLRLDSSVSYTYPQHQDALVRLRDVNPKVIVVYAVRDPLARLVSHFHLTRYYAGQTKWPTLGIALDASPMFVSSGAYDHWLPRLREVFPLENVLVVPFPAITRQTVETTNLILRMVGLEASEEGLEAPSFRNEVRQFRYSFMADAHRHVVGHRVYPRIRRVLGAERLRRLRRGLTQESDLPSVADEIASLSDAQRDMLWSAREAALQAVDEWLDDQDRRMGTAWLAEWKNHIASTTSP